MKLLLDLGNTRLKWALQHEQRWSASDAASWDEDLARSLLPAWRQWDGVQRALGASVVDDIRRQQLEQLVERAFGCAVEWLETPAKALGVRNAYAEPKRLGVDRFLSLLAAHGAGLAPCIRIGAGTALTLDALAADGCHLGGLIAPGPTLMQQSLLQATAKIQLDRAGAVYDLATNTADAVASGCWQMAVALIERFVKRIAPRLGGTPAVLIDGGDAERLLNLLELPAQHWPDGVLRGLARWADHTPPTHSSVHHGNRR